MLDEVLEVVSSVWEAEDGDAEGDAELEVSKELELCEALSLALELLEGEASEDEDSNALVVCDTLSLELVGELEREVDVIIDVSELVRVSETDEADSEAEAGREVSDVLRLLGTLDEELDVISRV